MSAIQPTRIVARVPCDESPSPSRAQAEWDQECRAKRTKFAKLHETSTSRSFGRRARVRGEAVPSAALARTGTGRGLPKYRKSLEKQEAFDTLCNLGRAEAQDKLFVEAYEHLSYCVALYPDDEELASAKAKFTDLRDEVRPRLSSDQIQAIDRRVDEDMQARAEGAKVLEEGPASGLEGEEGASSEPQMERVKWKLPVVLSLAGAGVASGVFGGVMLGVSAGQMGDAEDLQGELGDSGCFDSSSTECSELDDKLSQADTSKNLGVGFLVGGGVALVSSIALYVIVPNEREVKSTSGMRFETPVVGASPEGVSFSLGGTF